MSISVASREAKAKVPPISGDFWTLKLLTTAGGEALSDYLASVNILLAAVLGCLLLAVTAVLQLRARSYQPLAYWFFVAAIAVFGTMVADVMHVALDLPYLVTSISYAALLTIVLVLWHRATGTIDIHSVTTGGPERWYWFAVIAAFALGTALGDVAAISLGMGYLGAAVLFAGLFAIPWLLHERTRWAPTLTFWSAYVLTRPLGASVADFLGKPSGLAWGDGWVALGIFAVFALMLARAANRFEGHLHD